MKLLILLLTVALQVSAKGYGQAITLSLKDASLDKFFTEIRKQTGYYYSYPDKLVKDIKPITIETRNASIIEVLDKILKPYPNIIYRVSDGTIVLKEKSESKTEIKSPNNESIPPIDVKGKIVNEKGEPVIASVQVKGSNNGTTTNEKGEFVLKDVDVNAILLISGVNIESHEIRVNGKADLSKVSVRTKIISGETVQIFSTGYQNLPKERTTGSFTKIDNELFERRVSTDIISRLDGIANGVLFDKRNNSTSSFSPIQIRGLFTLTGQISNPLIVLDNFPYEGNLNDINPNDIENITILKDAAAASIWGARAGNGVIVITSKRVGYNQPLRIAVNSNITIVERPNLFNLQQVNSSEYIDIEKFLFSKNAFFSDTASASRPPFTPVYEILFRQRRGEISMAEAESQINALRKLDVRNDFEKYIYRNAVNQQHALSISGGANKIKYYFSSGFDKNLLGLRGNNFQRLSFRSDNTINVTKNLELQLGAFYTESNSSDNSPGGYGSSNYNIGSKRLYPYASFIDPNGKHLSIDTKYRGVFTDTAGRGQLLDWKYRPLDELSNNDKTAKSKSLLANIGVRYKFLNKINIEISYRYQSSNIANRNYRNIESFFTRDLINRFTNLSTSSLSIKYPVPKDGIMDIDNSTSQVHAARGQVNFDHNWNSKHNIAAIAGGEIRHAESYSEGFRIYGYNERLNVANVDYINRYPIYATLSPNTTIPARTTVSDAFDRFVSIYANAAYSYNNIYTITGSVRKDASNLFGVKTNQKGTPFWSLGGKWRIAKESFYKMKAFSDMSLRITYGYNGNVNNSIAALTTLQYFPSNFQVTNIPSAAVLTNPNPSLRWEKVRTLNTGLDFTVNGNRISGSIEYYSKKSTDVVANAPLDPTTGISAMKVNSANISGSGIEIQVNAAAIDSRSFKWNISFIFNYSRYKITRHLSPLIDPSSKNGYTSNGNELITIVGYHPYLVVSNNWAGLDPNTGDPQGLINGRPSKNYDSLRLVSLYDQVIHGPAIPPYFGSILNSLSWKGITLSANITYRFGYYFRRNTLNYDQAFRLVAIHSDYLKRWQKPGDEQFTNVPSMIYPNPSTKRDAFYENSEVNVEKGDHIRFEDIKISYDLPQKFSTKRIFNRISIYAYLNNLNLIIWKANKAGLDPDYLGGLVPPRSYAFGIKAIF